jgi:hypothetical protein
MISRWSLSSKGDEDLDEYEAGEDEDMHVFGSFKRCSQGALDIRAIFFAIQVSRLCRLCSDAFSLTNHVPLDDGTHLIAMKSTGFYSRVNT